MTFLTRLSRAFFGLKTETCERCGAHWDAPSRRRSYRNHVCADELNAWLRRKFEQESRKGER